MTKIEFMEKIAKIQRELKAPKNQYNKFGGYKYRNCEDILESAKPLLNGLVLSISDEIVLVGTRFYVRATATITDGENTYSATAYAREEESKKGMDASQLTGSTSSYARKYALNGLFCIDDTRDADSADNSGASAPIVLPEPTPAVIDEINTCAELPQIAAILRKYKNTYNNDALSRLATARKQEILSDLESRGE